MEGGRPQTETGLQLRSPAEPTIAWILTIWTRADPELVIREE